MTTKNQRDILSIFKQISFVIFSFIEKSYQSIIGINILIKTILPILLSVIFYKEKIKTIRKVIALHLL